jgi:hypothetical protein
MLSQDLLVDVAVTNAHDSDDEAVPTNSRDMRTAFPQLILY